MNLPALLTDNITEILLKIIEFTSIRQKTLIQNINLMHTAGFMPKDLPVDEFSRLMFEAVSEYADSKRLVLRDGPNVKFGAGGSFEVIPVIDEQTKGLFEKDRDEYLRVQTTKLLENSLNQKIATEMLKQKKSEEEFLGRCLN